MEICIQDLCAIAGIIIVPITTLILIITLKRIERDNRDFHGRLSKLEGQMECVKEKSKAN